MKKFSLALGTLLLSTTPAWAHPGHETASFSSGLTHPVTGFDHLIMLIAFGILVACLNVSVKRQVLLIGAALLSMASGLLAGKWFGFISGVELAIAASLFVVSGAIWQAFSASQNTLRLAVSLCVGLIFFHGYAHGVEAQGAVSHFGLGMLLSACALMVLGIQFGRAFRSPWLSLGVVSVSALVVV
ncbi:MULTISPECIES: HupE/UreJ family protein [Vibrio]|uniref:Urease accessory protein UreJ n=1 Tax=Vibrio proteolyticus NBRC 13287 TaxID=1219065 RepID=U3B6Q6_VIBPR|nr:MULTISPECIES: HupE/UreJ family protein [Vibrio]NAW57135.1 urease accessory protein UreJ [Vibrio sp. V36_P2S2PM302]NAX20562.1 urease accessory protein UreJ [Vibrio sp. V39_P1S14PM300]NAX24570.1 urease accessory protein UreJ [Vibrio sp. V38_P2S17PM301]NAX31029.1 urease accessory protein UreJ [Vibrio sp. V37_P2S8PM304]GAD65534.1 urease accessory protein UreJ [Vibrio proteolyticus NBRC 13287]